MIQTVTFVIPAYNNPHQTEECIASLRYYFPNAPVILVDDGSPEEDGTFFVRLQTRYQLLLLRQTNQGKGVALNQGFRLVKTKFVVACDNDIVFHGAAWLEKHLTILDKDSRIAGIGGWGNPDFLDEHGNIYHEANYWSEPGYCEMVNGGLVTSLTSVALMIPRDEEFSFVFEDIAWACRVKRAGYVLYLSPAQIEHRMGTNIYPHDFVKQRHQMLSRLVESYSDVLEPRKPREAVRLFMETGLWLT